ncbi:hypothetical protein V6N13_072718 [Hibiscus sabdariffa]|uniref:Uncharacterized protein n=1 Tax=Hibiscus sabdariffa TaxID=183260 RepID=A0ABR2E6X3_9ROSI
MSEEFDFADKVPPSFYEMGNKIIYETEAKGLNPGLIVLLVVVGLLLIFLVGNYVLYTYAQKTLPPRKKKPVSKKKMKRERLKQGVSAPGEGPIADGLVPLDRPPDHDQDKLSGEAQMRHHLTELLAITASSDSQMSYVHIPTLVP